MARWDKAQLHEAFRSMLHARHESDILMALAEVLDIQEDPVHGDPVSRKISELARDIKANHDR